MGYLIYLLTKYPMIGLPNNLVGSVVQVPLRGRIEVALIEQVFKEFLEPPSFTVRNAHSIEPFPNDKLYKNFVSKLSQYYGIDSLYFLQTDAHFLQEKEMADANFILNTNTESTFSQVNLTEEQQVIAQSIAYYIKHPKYYPALLYGVTGSGKTEIYKRLILDSVNEKKTALLLLPEVSLAVQFTQILKNQLPDDVILHSFHSATSIKEKRALWSNLVNNKPIVIVGVHLPILLPISNLGIIIIDEEHDVGYQEKKYPKINTKEVALIRAQANNIAIVLGSATPSIASLYNVQHKSWHLFELKNRFAGSLHR